MPVVICELENGESMLTERGSMSWMSPNIGNEHRGRRIGKAFGRMFSGEAMFQNTYTGENGRGMLPLHQCSGFNTGGDNHAG